jgi:hypothetical protein
MRASLFDLVSCPKCAGAVCSDCREVRRYLVRLHKTADALVVAIPSARRGRLFHRANTLLRCVETGAALPKRSVKGLCAVCGMAHPLTGGRPRVTCPKGSDCHTFRRTVSQLLSTLKRHPAPASAVAELCETMRAETFRHVSN